MEKEAVILRARAEHAKLAAAYAADDSERLVFERMAIAYESQARQLEDRLDGWQL